MTKMITKDIAVSLTYRTELYSSLHLGSDKRPVRCRVNGKCKTWKTRPNDFKLPVKHGLYNCFYIENDEWAKHWHVDESEAMAHLPSATVTSERMLDASGRMLQINTLHDIADSDKQDR